ncbi:vacuolar membrane-associated protein IML1 [Annulohypoxylon truncatum]|uniref:vacuolar membrane-associated protein IML1 n=1 Tax=Annulohypoxylon truncatum TaxID=327061 RepID=UPI0020081FB7|nr:vacuolar membrane-associated protein IML1 [Annulohypoxylon truncatum]KAI1209527.1 vacuolar membrane-associated protein IML1 [Annulohypoxylon truncatum]
MSRNSALSPSAPRRASQWTSHLRQFSKSSLDRTSEESPISPDTVFGNPTTRDPSSSKRPNERICSVTINESVIRDEVLVNFDLFGGTLQPGALMSITPIKSDQDRASGPQYGSSRQASYNRGFTNFTLADDLPKPDGDGGRRYVFVAKDVSKELKARQPNVEVYVSKQIGNAFNMRKGTQVILAPVDNLTPAVEASHVELTFKDMYMSRADMWRLAVADLTDHTVYKGQVVFFLGAIKATVSTVFVEGRRARSAFFGRNTRPIFRSESARYVLFIQMAREMWDFDSDGSGEIMFSKVVNGFLPALFKKWALLQVKHLVSIVLFARVEYDTGLTTEFANSALHNDYYTGYQTFGDRRPFKDFYRVVVSEMSSGEWTKILNQLKMEFNVFRRDISLHHQDAMSNDMEIPEDPSAKSTSTSKIKAHSSLAMYGNFLEAINLASSLYAHDYVDRDLLRTGISIVVISPGPGVFEVGYESLRRTTEALVGNGIGIDLICIPNIPLHSVPLFRYRNPHFLEANQRSQPRQIRSRDSTPKQPTPLVGSYTTLGESVSPTKAGDSSSRVDSGGSTLYADEWAFAVPQWLHISYWTGKSEEALSFQGISLSASAQPPDNCHDEFTIRCRLYDLQMRSVLETNEIETTPLHADPTYSSTVSNYENKTKLLQGDERLSTHIGNRKVPETLFEPVYGFLKFNPDKLAKAGETLLWKKLQAYDETRARLPAHRPLPPTHHYRELEESAGKQLMEDLNLFGTSIGDSKDAGPSTGLSSSVSSSSRIRLDVPTSAAASRRNSTTKSKPPSARQPKFMRQISLGQRGFGIAAAQPFTGEVKIEHATRVDTTGPGSNTPSTPKLTPITPIKSATRPGSSQSSSIRNIPATIIATDSATGLTQALPSLPIQIKNPAQTLDPASTLRSGQIPATPIARSARPDDRDLRYSNTLREEDQKKLYNSKLRAGGVPELPTTLSPTTAMAPWLVVLNPSNPNVHKVDDSILFSRWQHVFPRPSEMRVMKWKSLSCPAAVPLTTEYFPTQAQFNVEYQRQPYNISQEVEDEIAEQPRSRVEFLRELVSARFSHGFQVVTGPSVAKAFDQKVVRIADVFSIDKTVGDGTSIFMSVGNTIHQLSCVNGTEVEVNIYIRKPTEPLAQITQLPSYKPAIRTLLDDTYHSVDVDIMTPKSERNWNYIDSYLAGHTDEMTENLRFWRARFVLIPMYPRTSSAPAPRNEDDEEEVRLEGIKRLAQLWQRYRFLSPSERQFQSVGARKRDPNPLDITYKTEDPSVVIAAEMETLPLFENVEVTHRKGLVSDRERFSKTNFNVAALAEAIQQPVELGGIRMQTRRWHFRIHYHCFIGSDMTTWLLDNFEDLDSREEAVELGNSLMVLEEDKSRERDKDSIKDAKKDRDRGIFVHVERRHPFRDGQFFYQVVSDYAKPHPVGWFNSRKRDVSVPSTPLSENLPKDSPRPSQPGIQKSMSIHEENSPISGSTTPTLATTSGRKPKVVLSKMMKYDVDPRKKSYRPERINLHYDRLHNPDNCYHIRIDWMNVTARLIEDALKSWATIAAQHGLRLVEVPIAEACRITEINPFRRPYHIKLSLPPPAQHPVTYYDPTSFGPQAQPGKHYYQKALLKKFNYVLDVEAASNFPSNVDVSYSWGKPDFKYSQYVHRSGVILAEITDEGDFLVLANRLCSNRAAAFQPAQARAEAMPNERVSRLMNTSAYTNYGLAEPTPISSPMFRPVLFASAASRTQPEPSPSSSTSGPQPCPPSPNVNALGEPEAHKDALEKFCSDANALEAFYKETLEKGVMGTPMAGAAAPGPDAIPEANIPTLTLGGNSINPESGASPGPRIPTPNLAGSLLFRRGSIQH